MAVNKMSLNYIACVRKNLDSEVFLGKEVRMYDMPVKYLLDPTEVPIGNGIDVSVDNFMKFMGVFKLKKGDRVLLLIHGYHVEEENALSAYADVIKGIEANGFTYPLYIYGLWPGSWAYAGFWPAQGRAERSAELFVPLIQRLMEYGLIVDIEGHSLGCHVGLEIAHHLHMSKQVGGGNLILTAPAVDNISICEKRDYYEACTVFDKITICWSKYDKVLQYAYGYGNAVWQTLSLSVLKRGFQKALGFTGAIPVFGKNVVAFDYSAEVKSHSGYKSCASFLAQKEIWQYWLTKETPTNSVITR